MGWSRLLTDLSGYSGYWLIPTADVNVTWASNCFRRGEAEAKITLFPRIAFSAGRSSGRGARAIGGLTGGTARLGDWAAVSYDGGGSVGARAYLVSAIFEQ